jgi:hypothetical protein
MDLDPDMLILTLTLILKMYNRYIYICISLFLISKYLY